MKTAWNPPGQRSRNGPKPPIPSKTSLSTEPLARVASVASILVSITVSQRVWTVQWLMFWSVAQSRRNLRFYAVKVLNKEKVVRLKQVDHTNSEQGILLAISHPFIINLWGTFQDSANLYMIMDFVHGGELFTLLRKAQGGVGRVFHLQCAY